MDSKSRTCFSQKTGKPLAEYDLEVDAQGAACYVSAQYKRAMTPYLCQVCHKWHLTPTNRHTPSEPCNFCVGSDGQPKASYHSQEEAGLRARIIRKEQGVSLRVYACKVGHGWHLTRA